MVPNIDNKINLIPKNIKLVVDPPLSPIMANEGIGATSHYFTPEDSHALVNIQPTNIGLRVRLPDNSTMNPHLVGHLPLALPPTATERHVFAALQNTTLLSVG